MKKIKSYPFAFFFSLVLIVLFSTGCPVGLDYPPGKPGTEKADKNLIGTWTNEMEDAEVGEVVISKKDDFSYYVKVNKKGSMYSLEGDEFTGWMTTISGKTFFYAKPEEEDKYYIYHYELNGKKEMVSHDVSLKVGGVDGVHSTEDLVKEITASLKMEDCLNGEIAWTKE